MSACLFCMTSRRRFVGLLSAATFAAPAFAASAPADVVDFHTHVLHPGLGPDPSTLRGREAWAKRLLEPKLHIEHMDRVGVGRHVVGQVNVLQGITWGDARTDLEAHRRINDRIAEQWVGAHPGRFAGAFGLPTQDLKLALPELERAVTKLGMKVLQISSCTPEGVYYGDPRLHPLWEAVRHFGVTVFIHPHGQAKQPPLADFGLWNSIGQGIEEAKVMSSIIYQGVFDKFPGVKIIISHGGGFLPHYYGRMDRNVKVIPESAINISRYPSAYLKEFYYDSCVYAPEILTALIKIVGVDRIVLGGDFPMGPADPVALLKATPGLGPNDADRILRRTAATLLA